MIIVRIISSLLLLFVFSLASAQTEIVHEIDRELDACLESAENFTTAGMSDCIKKATARWDEELNLKYKELTTILSPVQKEKLKTSQRAWLSFRDSEISFSSQIYTDLDGTIWIPVAARRKLDLTRQRTLELSVYIEDLTNK